jgi:hypothetical protein
VRVAHGKGRRAKKEEEKTDGDILVEAIREEDRAHAAAGARQELRRRGGHRGRAPLAVGALPAPDAVDAALGRAAAERDVDEERRRLQQFKGIGKVGGDIFLREVQAAWDEVRPFADRRVLQAARTLGLGSDAKSVAKHVSKKDFPKLASALVRVQLGNASDAVKQSAA